jgi:hypothetical protein
MGTTHLSKGNKMVGKGWEGQVQILAITNNAFKHSFCVFFNPSKKGSVELLVVLKL